MNRIRHPAGRCKNYKCMNSKQGEESQDEIEFHEIVSSLRHEGGQESKQEPCFFINDVQRFGAQSTVPVPRVTTYISYRYLRSYPSNVLIFIRREKR